MLIAAAGGCADACGSDSELRVAGSTPYVRCLAAEPPPDGSRQLGAVRIESREGRLQIEGLRTPIRLAAFSGPGFAELSSEQGLEALRAVEPDLLLMIGGVGDTLRIATETLRTLARVGVPALMLAGGRDSRERIEQALSALPDPEASRIIDVSTAHGVQIGKDVLVPVAGSLDGRYALDDGACGYASADLKALAGKVPRGEARRWLIAWDAPAGSGEASVARTAGGLDVGSAPLAALARAIGARGGLFAWPHAQVLRASAAGDQRRVAVGAAAEPDLRLVVPRLSGPAMERSDGSRAPAGFALLELAAGGMRVLSTHALP